MRFCDFGSVLIMLVRRLRRCVILMIYLFCVGLIFVKARAVVLFVFIYFRVIRYY